MDFQSNKSRVAIVGRPNVGKSSLFNILVGARRSLVKNQPGVTRDILVEEVELWGRQFDLIDTGGLTAADDIFSEMIFAQVEQLLNTVDLILLIFDGRAGLLPEDSEVVKIVKKSGKPFLAIVNKVDSIGDDELKKAEFYQFGFDLIAVSFERRLGLPEILEWLHSHIKEFSPAVEPHLTLTIVGKPNAGKSSLCNYLLKDNRVLVSEIPGTTVDSVDLQLVYNHKNYILIDTAGLRRHQNHKGLEMLSAVKSVRSLDRADIVLHLVDGLIGPTHQDAKIIEHICNRKKAVILVANKSDLGKEQTEGYRKKFREQVNRELHFFTDIPVEFISAKTGFGIDSLFKRIDEVWNKIHFRISTSELNDFFFETIRKAPAPVYGTRNVKFYYLTQTHQIPPSFIAFVNHPEGVTPSYRRFLIKQIQARWGLEGIPIQIYIMKSGRKNQTTHLHNFAN